jgi:hypothetical protein
VLHCNNINSFTEMNGLLRICNYSTHTAIRQLLDMDQDSWLNYYLRHACKQTSKRERKGAELELPAQFRVDVEIPEVALVSTLLDTTCD